MKVKIEVTLISEGKPDSSGWVSGPLADVAAGRVRLSKETAGIYEIKAVELLVATKNFGIDFFISRVVPA